MLRSSFRLSSVCLLVAGLCSGNLACSQAEYDRPGGTFRVQHLGQADWQQAFAAAVGAISEHFRVISADSDSGIIRCEPAEFTRGGLRMRRIAQLQLRRADQEVIAACQVRIQRHATAGARSWSEQRSAEDLPTATPIQEEAGLTPQQREYWADEGRDYQLERQILARLVGALASLPQPSAQSRPARSP